MLTPRDFGLEDIPKWADERGLGREDEAHYNWVEDHQIFDVEPREAEVRRRERAHHRKLLRAIEHTPNTGPLCATA